MHNQCPLCVCVESEYTYVLLCVWSPNPTPIYANPSTSVEHTEDKLKIREKLRIDIEVSRRIQLTQNHGNSEIPQISKSSEMFSKPLYNPYKVLI